MPNSPAYRRRRNLIINYETEHLALGYGLGNAPQTDTSPVNAAYRTYIIRAREQYASVVIWPHYSPAAAQKCAA